MQYNDAMRMKFGRHINVIRLGISAKFYEVSCPDRRVIPYKKHV